MNQFNSTRQRSSILNPICVSLSVVVALVAFYVLVLPSLYPNELELLALLLKQKTHWTFYAPQGLCVLGGVALITIWAMWAAGTEVLIPVPAPKPEPKPEPAPVPKPDKLLYINYMLSDGETKKQLSVKLKTIRDISGYIIGSNPKCALYINDATLNPEHAELRMIDGRLYIKCLSGSMRVQTGVFNANEQCKVRDADQVLLGGVSFCFKV